MNRLFIFMYLPFLLIISVKALGDDFEKLFVNTKEYIILDETKAQYESPAIGNNYIDDNFDIFICDFQAKNVKRYDKKGRLLTIYGKGGEGPGEFILPYTVAAVKNRIIVKDLFKNKLMIFDKDSGKFVDQKEIFLGCHHIEINRNEQLFCGLTQFSGKEKVFRLNSNLVQDGKFFDIKLLTDVEYKEWPWLPMDFDSNGNIYIVSWLSYKVAVFDKNLKLIRIFGEPSKYWNPPADSFPKDIKKNRTTSSKYTKMINVFSLNDKYILTIRTVSNNNELWYLDLYNSDGKMLYHDISSTRLIVGKDNLSNIYVNTFEEKGNDIIQKLTKFKLRKLDL